MEKPNVPFACATGPACRTVDAQGREDRSEFDAAGRVAWTIQNFCDGSTTGEFTYAPDGGIATQTMKNSTTGDQVTRYAYGTTLTDSEIADTRLLRGIVYPDSQNTFTMAGGAPTFSGTYNRVEFTYNCQGEHVTKKDPNETVHTFEYDLLGRQTSDKITAVDGDIFQGVLRVEHDYEVRGMVEQVTSYDAATGGSAVNDVKFEYDDFGLLSTDQQEHLGTIGAGSLSVQYARANGADNHARLNTVTYPNGRVLHHEYSSGNDSDLSRVSYLSETNGSGTRYAAYTYLGAGRIVRVDCNKISDNDPTHSCNLAFGTDNDPYDGLDQFGRVIDLRWTNYAGTTDLAGIKHGYDRAGNRLWRRDVVSAAQATPVYLDELYAYDGMYQLTSLRRGQLNSTEDDLETDSKKFAEQWTLDPLGNWTNFKQDTDADSAWELDQARTHNKANEIATITGEGVEVAHDAAGNMVVAPKPENWASHYHFIYDLWNRLVEVQTADQSKMVRAYEYDGLGRMISKWSYDEDAFSLSEWRHYYYSDQWQFLEERVADSYTGSYSGSGIPAMSGWGLSGSGVAGTFRLDRQFVWGLRYVNDLVLRDRDTNTNGSLDERLYALQDPNWNVVAIANTSGAIQERYCYSAYGKPSFLTSAFAVRDPDVSSYDWETLYSGYRYDYHADSDVKWHIAGHRILLSHLGRWNRRDPIGYFSNMNLYHYVSNNPARWSDAFGLREGDVRYGGFVTGPVNISSLFSDFNEPGASVLAYITYDWESLGSVISGCKEGSTTLSITKTRTAMISTTYGESTTETTVSEVGIEIEGVSLSSSYSTSTSKLWSIANSFSYSTSITASRTLENKDCECIKIEAWVMRYRLSVVFNDNDYLIFDNSGSVEIVWYTNTVDYDDDHASCPKTSGPCPLKP